MAIYLLHVKSISRAKGGRITRSAAYRAGERIRDERTREVYNFSDRDDVVHKEIETVATPPKSAQLKSPTATPSWVSSENKSHPKTTSS
jgi:hypothetical protein